MFLQIIQYCGNLNKLKSSLGFLTIRRRHHAGSLYVTYTQLVYTMLVRVIKCYLHTQGQYPFTQQGECSVASSQHNEYDFLSPSRARSIMMIEIIFQLLDSRSFAWVPFPTTLECSPCTVLNGRVVNLYGYFEFIYSFEPLAVVEVFRIRGFSRENLRMQS